MPRERGRLTMTTLIRAWLRRSVWRSAAGLLVSLIAAGTLFSALVLFSGMQTALDASLRELRAELVLTRRGDAAAATQLASPSSTIGVSVKAVAENEMAKGDRATAMAATTVVDRRR